MEEQAIIPIPVADSARNRNDNMPTHTIDAVYTQAQRLNLDNIDAIKAVVDYIKISNGPFVGKRQSSTSSNRTSSRCITYQKFIINVKSVLDRAITVLPRGMEAARHVDNIFRELSPDEEQPDLTSGWKQDRRFGEAVKKYSCLEI